MQTPYPSLTPAQVEIAVALVACPQWRWGSGTTALRADGALVEIMPGRAMGMERSAMVGLLPLLTDPAVVGHLTAALDAACGPQVRWSCGRQGASYEAHLEAGPHRRSWTGTCLGEALAGALVARWWAMGRKPPPPGKTVAVPVRGAGSSASARSL